MAANVDVPDELEDYNAVELCDWLEKGRNCKEEITKPLRDANITGRIFLDLDNEDLKDLFDSFLLRKTVRGILQELRNYEEESVTPQKKFKYTSSSHNAVQVNQTPMIKPIRSNNTTSPKSSSYTCITAEFDIPIPKSVILEEYENNSILTLDLERKKIVRNAMDTLIGLRGGRPSEHDLLQLSKVMAATYPALRDNPKEGRALTGFLRRRMYNVTPAVTNKGRKKGYMVKSIKPKNLSAMDSALTDNDDEPVNTTEDESLDVEIHSSGSTQVVQTSNGGKVNPQNLSIKEPQTSNVEEPQTPNGEQPQHCGHKENEELEVKDRSAEALMKAVKGCSPGSRPSTVKQLLRLTAEMRYQHVMTGKKKITNILKEFPVLTKPEYIIYDMILQLPEPKTALDVFNVRILEVAEKLLDYLYSKGMLKCPRSFLKTNDQKIICSFCHLPAILGQQKGTGKIKGHNLLIHIVKNDETWQAAATEHKTVEMVWILYNRIGDKTSLMIMYRDNPLFRCSSAEEAIMCLMATYYIGVMPYPSVTNGCLLYIQEHVLKDNVHEKDVAYLKKAQKNLDKFTTQSVNDFDIFS